MKITISKEFVRYVTFGVLGCAINYGIFWVGVKYLPFISVLVTNIVAFFVATLFAYITSKKYVFKVDRDHPFRSLVKKFAMFFSTRILSLCFELFGLWIGSKYFFDEGAEIWNVDAIMLLKIILMLLASLINYVITKFVVFKDV